MKPVIFYSIITFSYTKYFVLCTLYSYTIYIPYTLSYAIFHVELWCRFAILTFIPIHTYFSELQNVIVVDIRFIHTNPRTVKLLGTRKCYNSTTRHRRLLLVTYGIISQIITIVTHPDLKVPQTFTWNMYMFYLSKKTDMIFVRMQPCLHLFSLWILKINI